MVVIRKFEAADWAAYRDIRLSALIDSPDAFGSTYEVVARYEDSVWQARTRDLSDQHDCPLGAFDGAAAVGLTWGSIDRLKPGYADVYQMWTSPLYRGQGLGRALLDAVMAWAARQGATEAVLAVTIGNEPARRLYESAGFRPRGEPEPLRQGSAKRVQPMSCLLVPVSFP